MECDHTTTLDCVHHEHSSAGHGIEMVRGNMGCDHTIAWGVTIPSHGIVPSMAGACAWKGAGEVTPKGLYFRKGRVDEHSEIYPV